MSFFLKPLNNVALVLLVLTLGFPRALSALDLQKPETYSGDEEIKSWVMSEKLDGVRGYWDGKSLYTRQGKIIHAPEWFLENFPPFELDGELWSDRGQFEIIQSTVLDQLPSEDWQRISYNIFEVPNADGKFLSRLKKASDWFSKYPNTHVNIIDQIPCRDKEHLQEYLATVEAKGGEGVIVKDPDQPYHTGRSPHILKVKNFNDMEATVVAVNPGKGKYQNMMGSLTLKLVNGKLFKLGTGYTDQDRKSPPKIGAIVTFKYHGFTKNGIPKFASYLRVRKD